MSRYVVWIIAAALAGVAFLLGAKLGSVRSGAPEVARSVWDDPGVRKVRAAAYRKIEKAAERAANRL